MSVPALLVSLTFTVHAQRVRGELRLDVRDAQGGALDASAEMVSDANQIHRTFRVADGRYVAQDLPFGIYRLRLTAQGFAPWADRVEIRSGLPVQVAVTLSVAPLAEQVQADSATLLGPHRTGAQYSIGRRTLGETIAAQPGRDLSDLG